MRGTWTNVLTGGVASLVLVAAVHAGGWAIVTLRDLPQYAIAGTPLQLTFMVRQHGVSPMGGLAPEVAASTMPSFPS